MLKYSFGNSKMNKLATYLGYKQKEVVCFDLPAGWTCPKANICKTFSNRETGKLTMHGSVKCFASKGETYAPSARRLRWHNFDAIKACGRNVDAILELLESSMPQGLKVLRFHSSGDFFWKEYWLAWVELARRHPNITVFGYTKIYEYATWENLPSNFYIQYSYGGKDDAKLAPSVPTCYIGERENQYPNIKVVCRDKATGYEDYLAIINRETFVIPAH